jgi:hypothetical protein
VAPTKDGKISPLVPGLGKMTKLWARRQFVYQNKKKGRGFDTLTLHHFHIHHGIRLA